MPDEEELRVRLQIDTGELDEIERRLRSIQSQLDGIKGDLSGVDAKRSEIDQLEADQEAMLNRAGLTRDPSKGKPSPFMDRPQAAGEKPDVMGRLDKDVPFKRSTQAQEEYLNSIKDTVRQQTAEMRQHQRSLEDLERVDELKRRTEDRAVSTDAPEEAGAPKGRLSNLRDFASRFGSYVRQGREEIQQKIQNERGESRRFEGIVQRPSQLIDRFFRTAGMTGAAMFGGSATAFYGGVGAALGAGIGMASRGAATVVAKGTEITGMALGAAAGAIVGKILHVPDLARTGARIGAAGGRFAGTVAGNVIAGAGEMIASALPGFGAMAGQSIERSAQIGMMRSDASARLTAMGGSGGMLGTAGGMGYVTEEGAEAAGGFLQATGGAAGFEGFLRFGRGHGITPEEQLSYAPIFRMAGGTMPGGPGWENVMRMGAGAARRSGLGHARLPEFLAGTAQLSEQMMGQKDVMGKENVQALMGMQALIGQMGEAYQGERGANFLGRINSAITEGGGGGARREFMLQALGYTPGQGLQSRLMAEQRLEEGMANAETFGAILRHTSEVYGGGFVGQRALAGLLGLRQEEARKLQEAYGTSKEEFEEMAKLMVLGKEDPIAAAMISGAESFAVGMEARRLQTADASIEIIRNIKLLQAETVMTLQDVMSGTGDVDEHMNALAGHFKALITPLNDAFNLLVELVKGPQKGDIMAEAAELYPGGRGHLSGGRMQGIQEVGIDVGGYEVGRPPGAGE